MKFKILIVIALMIVSFFAGYYFAPSDSGEVENAGAICTNGVFLDSVQCECPDGYTKTGVPFPPSGTGNYVYCKVDMNWEDFEHLVRELFEREFEDIKGEVKVTQSSRDRGVDAVAFDPDPIKGGKIIIQAKRYTNTVKVESVRALYGIMQDEGAMKGILITTSDFGSDAYHFAKDKPITLLSGNNLLSMLEKHGHKARINLKEAKRVLNERGEI